MHKFISKFKIGQTVFLEQDASQSPKFVTGVQFRQGTILYIIGDMGSESYHYDFELNEDRDMNKVFNINN